MLLKATECLIQGPCHCECSQKDLLTVLCKDHVSVDVCRKIQAAIREYEKLLTLVKKQKLWWFAHISRSSDWAKTILQGTVKGKIGRVRKRGRKSILRNGQMDFSCSNRAAEDCKCFTASILVPV